jgi:hypothetical protein
MKIILIIPDGVVVRNYLYSDFVNELIQRGFEIYVFHQIPNAAVTEIKSVTNNIKEFNFIPYFAEPFLARIFREVVVYARLLKMTLFYIFGIKTIKVSNVKFF